MTICSEREYIELSEVNLCGVSSLKFVILCNRIIGIIIMQMGFVLINCFFFCLFDDD